MIFFIMGSPRVFPAAPVAPDAAGGDGGLPTAGATSSEMLARRPPRTWTLKAPVSTVGMAVASVGDSETRRVRSNPDVPTRWKGQHTPRESL